MLVAHCWCVSQSVQLVQRAEPSLDLLLVHGHTRAADWFNYYRQSIRRDVVTAAHASATPLSRWATRIMLPLAPSQC